MKKRKTNKGDEDSEAPGWITTFSDLVTLLLTFFVLLFSFTSMDDKKLKVSFQNFSGSSGFLSFKEYGEISRPKEVLIHGLYKILGDRVLMDDAKVKDSDSGVDTSEIKGEGTYLDIQDIEGGFKVVLGDRVLFPSGSTTIKETAKPILKKIARFIVISGYQAYIDGHTDNVPIRSAQYASNEDLSIARAFSIKDYFTEVEKIPPEAAAITGYGALKSIAPNKLAKGRAKNRRVEIILKNQKYF